MPRPIKERHTARKQLITVEASRLAPNSLSGLAGFCTSDVAQQKKSIVSISTYARKGGFSFANPVRSPRLAAFPKRTVGGADKNPVNHLSFGCQQRVELHNHIQGYKALPIPPKKLENPVGLKHLKAQLQTRIMGTSFLRNHQSHLGSC